MFATTLLFATAVAWDFISKESTERGGSTAPVKQAGGETAKSISLSSVLRYYLELKSEDPSSWTEEKNRLLSKIVELEIDADGREFQLVHSVEIVASGTSAAPAAKKYAFVVQNSYVQPNADFPVNDSYTCEVLVFAASGGDWRAENLDLVLENRHEGGTRFAKSCEGFKITWKNNFPIFSRRQTFGPYAGGEFVEATERIFRKNGKYQMQ